MGPQFSSYLCCTVTLSCARRPKVGKEEVKRPVVEDYSVSMTVAQVWRCNSSTSLGIFTHQHMCDMTYQDPFEVISEWSSLAMLADHKETVWDT